MYRRSRKFDSIRTGSLANICWICFAFCVAAAGFAKADDLFRGSTDASKLVLFDASTNALLPETYSGQSYTQFSLINSVTNNQLGSILGAGGNLQSFAAVPEPSVGVMFGLGLLGLIGFQRWRRSSITR